MFFACILRMAASVCQLAPYASVRIPSSSRSSAKSSCEQVNAAKPVPNTFIIAGKISNGTPSPQLFRLSASINSRSGNVFTAPISGGGDDKKNIAGIEPYQKLFDLMHGDVVRELGYYEEATPRVRKRLCIVVASGNYACNLWLRLCPSTCRISFRLLSAISWARFVGPPGGLSPPGAPYVASVEPLNFERGAAALGRF